MNRDKPATSEYFDIDNKRPDKLTTQCKECRKENFLKYRNGQKEKFTNNPELIKSEGEKKCSICKTIKKINDFYIDRYSPNGRKRTCKDCCSELGKTEKVRESTIRATKKWRENNKGIVKVIIDKKVCSKCKIEKDVNEFVKDLYTITGYTHQCKKCREEKHKEYRQSEKGREKIREHDRNKYRNNVCAKIKRNISRSIQKILKEQNSSKNGETCLKYLPYTIEQLKERLESQFEEWMSWDNYGGWAGTEQKTWWIDHIIPQSELIYDSMDHSNFQKCWALENLRPLEKNENMKKGNKVLFTEEEVFGGIE